MSSETEPRTQWARRRPRRPVWRIASTWGDRRYSGRAKGPWGPLLHFLILPAIPAPRRRFPFACRRSPMWRGAGLRSSRACAKATHRSNGAVSSRSALARRFRWADGAPVDRRSRGAVGSRRVRDPASSAQARCCLYRRSGLMRWVGRERVNLGVATPHLPTAGLLELAAIADCFGAGRAVPNAKLSNGEGSRGAPRC
jgi:hypothetical protein